MSVYEFISEATIPNASNAILLPALKAHYGRWCAIQGQIRMPYKDLIVALEAHGFKRGRDSRQRYLVGFGLLPLDLARRAHRCVCPACGRRTVDLG